MANEPSILDVADEEFAQINKPEQKQEQGSILDIADDEFKKQEEESTQKEFDVAKLEKLKAEGKPLSEVQQRMIFDEQDKVPLLEQAGKGIVKFLPAAGVKVGELARGAYELAREGAVKPVYVGAKYNLGLATPKETNVAARGAEIAYRSAVSGVMSDLEDTAGTIIKGYESGSAFTDKLQGLSADERFKRYRWRETFSGYEQARREETPDRAAAVLSENVLLQKAAGIAAKMQGGTEEDAKEAEKAYSELVLESGLTREELNPYISSLGEVISPISIPGANIATKGIGKYTGKAVQKGGELALKGVVKPIATGVEKVAELTEKGITGVQTGARKLGEYVTGDPDTLIRGGSIAGLISAPQITGTILAAKPAAIATKEIARTVKDIASQVDVGGAAGRRGLVERAGRAAESGVITKKLFSAESRGGLGRARAADWMIRQGNAITQQGVNGAVLNTILGLPDIESIEQGFEAAGSGFGIGAFTGSRIMERAGAAIDPRTGLAQKIDTIITPDPSSRRADEDADIKRFLSSVDPDLVPKMEKLGSIDERKKAIQSKVDALEKQKNVTFGPEVELIKKEIIRQKQNIEKLDKSTPQTQKEILRQIHLAFADEMDLAKTTGKAAGLNNIQVKILDPSEMEGFFRNSYGATLTDAESVIASLTGKPDLSPQESENLINSRRIVDGFYNEIGSAQSARGLAISEGSDLEGNEVPAFMRKKNLQGATIVINGDLVKQLSNEGFNIRNVVGHEMQHALGRFTEVRDMLAPIRRELFDQTFIEKDGTQTKVSKGVYSDDKLDAYADTYASAMSPSDNGESFKAQFPNQDKLRAYIKEEILSEIAGRSGNVSGGTRAGLDSIGRQVVDWIEVNTQNGALKKIKETLRKGGIIVDDSGDISTVLGAELTPESLAMIRQYQRQLKNLNQSMVYEEDARKEEVEIPITKILSDRTLQEKFKNSDIFEKEQVATMTAPDGSKQEIPIPPNAGVDPFVGTYRIQGGQLVDESGNPMNLGPNITFGTMPDGTQVEVGTRIARNVDGSPKILSNREIEARSRNRGKVIRNAIDSALSKGALQLEDTGNGNYRGVMSEAQVNAVLALPNTIVSPNLKRQILFVNEILRRKDGTRMYMEYQAAMRGGKSRALAPQIRDEIPIGFQFSKQGNFLITTMSVSRMHDKMNAWLAKKPENLKLWNGDTASFWDDVIKVLDNHSKGERGETGLDPDAAIALEKKNAVNDLFNVWNADTKAANPRRTKLPVQKGKDPIDVIVRARRIDRINQYNESSLKKMPFNYELNRDNYMPAENPLADFQTPEDFANELPSVTAEEIRNAINTGNLDQVESRLREGDDLKPAESLDEKDGNIRIVSMFDNEFMPQESLDFVDVKPQFMPAETERYPTSERGMYSGLQKTIDEKVQGKFASPDQLKAIVNNPQNAKAEELKWSGVIGEIDRLAAENSGKVPKDKVMDYLRNEGAVKFEEVTLGGKEAFDQNRLNQLEAEYRNLKDHPIDDPSFGEDKYDELIKLINIRDQSTTDILYSEAERVMALAQQAQRRGDKKTAEKYFRENEFLNTRAEKLDLQGQGLANPPRFAGLQLPGGTNYREVVMTMPRAEESKFLTKSELNEYEKLRFETDNRTPEQQARLDQLLIRISENNAASRDDKSYTSSHFPETPNYVAHMRLNERTDAQGNEGLFVEEFQSDRHQAGREKGYKGEVGTVTIEKVGNIGWTAIRKNPDGSSTNLLIDVGGYYPKKESVEAEIKRMGDEGIPDAPFRKDWSIQLFKRALRDAVDSDKKWIGWTTGIEQVKRYEDAMRQVVDEISWVTPSGKPKAFGAIKNGKTVLGGKIKEDGSVYDSDTADANGKQLSEVVGKEVASKILAENSGTATGDDLTVGGEGMKGFYDQILPKEIGKYVAKMGGKVEKSEIGQEITEDDLDMGDLSDATPQELAELEATGKVVGNTVPIWRVNITPEMAGKVRGGQLQFMPAEQPTEYEPISARIRPLEGISAPTKVVGAKALSLGEIEPPVRGKAMLPDMELKPDISEKGIQSSDKTGLQFMPPEGEEKIKKNKDLLKLKMTKKALTDAALSQESWRDWYKEHQEVLEDFFGDYAELFQEILAVTSQASSVKANVGLALKAFGQLMRGEEFDARLRGQEKGGYLDAVIGNLNAIKNKTDVSGRKISNYKAANEGDVTRVVVDRHIARLLFGVDTPSKSQYDLAEKLLTEIANEIGWEPSQVQAALWAHSIVMSGKKPESYGAYLTKLESTKLKKRELASGLTGNQLTKRIGKLADSGAGSIESSKGRGRYSPVSEVEINGVKQVRFPSGVNFMPSEKIPTSKEILKKPLENLPLRDASTWTEIQKAPVITLKDLIGKKVFPTFADITSAGRVFKGIDSSELLIPVETHGGPEWPLIQSEKVGEETNVWSNQGAGVTTTKAKRADEGAIMLVTLMDKNAHMSNTEVANAIIGTNLAYVRDKRITEKNLKLLNKKIKSEEAFDDFVGIDSPDINDYVAKLPFQGDKSRARLSTILSSKESELLGAANVQRILDEMRSPAFEGGRIGDSVIALQLSKGAPVVKLSDSGGMTHPSYQYAVRGKVIGRFARPINAEMIYDDFIAQRRAEGKPQSGDRRAIDLAKPVQVITEQIANRIPQTPYKYLKSAKHAKLLQDAIENKWKDSSTAKNKGGISPAEFIDTLNSSEAKIALNDYTLDSIKKDIKDGKLSLYQLGDSKVFFGTKNSDPASDYGLDPKEYGFGKNEKTLTLVLNAERGTAGMGDAIMMKALSEGVTALDCFAIKNTRYPDGMLPSLYKRFGFEVVGEIPFDPQYYTPQKLADIKMFWKNNGWEESTGLPSVVMMKWKGNENDRTGSLRDIAGKTPAGIRERNTSPIRDAEGYFGRTDIGQGGVTQGGLQQGESGRVGGSAGDALQGIQLGRGTINAIQELFGMNDAELKNIGINPSQIQTIKDAIGYTAEEKK